MGLDLVLIATAFLIIYLPILVVIAVVRHVYDLFSKVIMIIKQEELSIDGLR